MIFGDSPLGTTPFASWDDDAGYRPGTVTVTFTGFQPAISGISPLRVTQLFRETMYSPNPTVRVTQVFREVLRAAVVPPVRVTQVFRESHYGPVAPPVRVTQIFREVLRSSSFTLDVDDSFITILW